MNEIKLQKQSVKKISLLLTFLILFSLFMSSENVFAEDFDIRDKVDFPYYREGILFDGVVYDYSNGPNKHQYLHSCSIEFSLDNKIYTPLVDVKVRRQDISKNINFQLIRRHPFALIEFDNTVDIMGLRDTFWPLDTKILNGEVKNTSDEVVLAFAWRVDSKHLNGCFMRISGNWMDDENHRLIPFRKVVYDKRKGRKSVLKSNASVINTMDSKNDTVNVFKESDEIVINGADPGANIKVYTTTGAEIKSVVSDNDVVKIKLPAKQIYVVNTWGSRYKVAL